MSCLMLGAVYVGICSNCREQFATGDLMLQWIAACMKIKGQDGWQSCGLFYACNDSNHPISRHSSTLKCL